ncbi:MAG: hypothetical protein ACXVP0_13985, partial [Bacteroidia bacterium]
GARSLFRIMPASGSIGFSNTSGAFITRVISLTKGDAVFLGTGFGMNTGQENGVSQRILSQLNLAAGDSMQSLHDTFLNQITELTATGGLTEDICIIGIKP